MAEPEAKKAKKVWDWQKARAKAWCFTLNNWTEEERESLWSNELDIRFLCYGEEQAPSTGTPHLQGYVQFYRQLYGTTVKRVAGLERAHLEPARSTLAKNREYCSKDGAYVERGKPMMAGYRTDLEACRDMILDGCTEREMALFMPHAYAMHFRAFRKMAEMFGKDEYEWDPPVPWRKGLKLIFFVGPTGSGKSHRAHTEYPGAYIRENDGTKWWDGYRGQKVIIIDEFKSWLPYAQMLKLCCDMPMSLPRRGIQNTPCKATTIVFTSIDHPKCWWPGVEDTKEWVRRIEQFGDVVPVKRYAISDPVIDESIY